MELVVRVDDQPRSLSIPRGKQDWWPTPHEIWYPRTTGIWQSVWLEHVPATSIAALCWTSDLPSLSVGLEAEIVGDVNRGDTLRVILHRDGNVLVDDTITLVDCIDGRSTVRRRFDLSDAVNGDPEELVWRPEHPQLLEATLLYAGGQIATRLRATPRSDRSVWKTAGSNSTANRCRCASRSTRATGRAPGRRHRMSTRFGKTSR